MLRDHLLNSLLNKEDGDFRIPVVVGEKHYDLQTEDHFENAETSIHPIVSSFKSHVNHGKFPGKQSVSRTAFLDFRKILNQGRLGLLREQTARAEKAAAAQNMRRSRNKSSFDDSKAFSDEFGGEKAAVDLVIKAGRPTVDPTGMVAKVADDAADEAVEWADGAADTAAKGTLDTAIAAHKWKADAAVKAEGWANDAADKASTTLENAGKTIEDVINSEQVTQAVDAAVKLAKMRDDFAESAEEYTVNTIEDVTKEAKQGANVVVDRVGKPLADLTGTVASPMILDAGPKKLMPGEPSEEELKRRESLSGAEVERLEAEDEVKRIYGRKTKSEIAQEQYDHNPYKRMVNEQQAGGMTFTPDELDSVKDNAFDPKKWIDPVATYEKQLDDDPLVLVGLGDDTKEPATKAVDEYDGMPGFTSNVKANDDPSAMKDPYAISSNDAEAANDPAVKELQRMMDMIANPKDPNSPVNLIGGLSQIATDKLTAIAGRLAKGDSLQDALKAMDGNKAAARAAGGAGSKGKVSEDGTINGRDAIDADEDGVDADLDAVNGNQDLEDSDPRKISSNPQEDNSCDSDVDSQKTPSEKAADGERLGTANSAADKGGAAESAKVAAEDAAVVEEIQESEKALKDLQSAKGMSKDDQDPAIVDAKEGQSDKDKKNAIKNGKRDDAEEETKLRKNVRCASKSLVQGVTEAAGALQEAIAFLKNEAASFGVKPDQDPCGITTASTYVPGRTIDNGLLDLTLNDKGQLVNPLPSASVENTECRANSGPNIGQKIFQCEKSKTGVVDMDQTKTIREKFDHTVYSTEVHFKCEKKDFCALDRHRNQKCLCTLPEFLDEKGKCGVQDRCYYTHEYEVEPTEEEVKKAKAEGKPIPESIKHKKKFTCDSDDNPAVSAEAILSRMANSQGVMVGVMRWVSDFIGGGEARNHAAFERSIKAGGTKWKDFVEKRRRAHATLKKSIYGEKEENLLNLISFAAGAPKNIFKSAMGMNQDPNSELSIARSRKSMTPKELLAESKKKGTSVVQDLNNKTLRKLNDYMDKLDYGNPFLDSRYNNLNRIEKGTAYISMLMSNQARLRRKMVDSQLKKMGDDLIEDTVLRPANESSKFYKAERDTTLLKKYAQEYGKYTMSGTNPLYVRKNLVEFTNVSNKKFQAGMKQDHCGKEMSFHPYIVFRRPVREVHIRIRDALHKSEVYWDADFVFPYPTRVLGEKYPAIRGRKLVGDRSKHGLYRLRKFCAWDSEDDWLKTRADLDGEKKNATDSWWGSYWASQQEKYKEARMNRYAEKQDLKRDTVTGHIIKDENVDENGEGANGNENKDKQPLLPRPPDASAKELLRLAKFRPLEMGKLWANNGDLVDGNGLCPDPYKPCHLYEMIVTTDRARVGGAGKGAGDGSSSGEGFAIQEGPQLHGTHFIDNIDAGMTPEYGDSIVHDRIIFGVQNPGTKPYPQRKDIIQAMYLGEKRPVNAGGGLFSLMNEGKSGQGVDEPASALDFSAGPFDETTSFSNMSYLGSDETSRNLTRVFGKHRTMANLLGTSTSDGMSQAMGGGIGSHFIRQGMTDGDALLQIGNVINAVNNNLVDKFDTSYMTRLKRGMAEYMGTGVSSFNEVSKKTRTKNDSKIDVNGSPKDVELQGASSAFAKLSKSTFKDDPLLANVKDDPVLSKALKVLSEDTAFESGEEPSSFYNKVAMTKSKTSFYSDFFGSIPIHDISKSSLQTSHKVFFLTQKRTSFSLGFDPLKRHRQYNENAERIEPAAIAREETSEQTRKASVLGGEVDQNSPEGEAAAEAGPITSAGLQKSEAPTTPHAEYEIRSAKGVPKQDNSMVTGPNALGFKDDDSPAAAGSTKGGQTDLNQAEKPPAKKPGLRRSNATQDIHKKQSKKQQRKDTKVVKAWDKFSAKVSNAGKKLATWSAGKWNEGKTRVKNASILLTGRMKSAYRNSKQTTQKNIRKLMDRASSNAGAMRAKAADAVNERWAKLSKFSAKNTASNVGDFLDEGFEEDLSSHRASGDGVLLMLPADEADLLTEGPFSRVNTFTLRYPRFQAEGPGGLQGFHRVKTPFL